jgi:DNA-binding response OmpR family regulator
VNALPGLGHYRADDAATRRFREAGDLTLDLTHQDGRVEDRWLGLTPREFAILWRLAERPGEPVGEPELMSDLWRVRFGCDGGDDIALHVARLAAKLAAFGLDGLVSTVPDGSYVLGAAPPRACPGPLLPRGH